MDKKNFLIISTADWDNPFWTNKQHVAKTLSDSGHRVVYFDSLGLRSPGKTSKDKTRIFRRLLSFLKGPRRINECLTVFSPIVIPSHSNSIITKLNNVLMFLYLKYFEFNYFTGSVVYWTYNPLSSSFLNENVIVYHCVDDLTAAPGLPIERIQKEEIQLLGKADLIYVTSKTLKNKFDRFGYSNKTYYFPNVVDDKHFSRQISDEDIPIDLANIKRPILGFIGAISSYKVDFNLLHDLSRSRPDCSIVLIGQVGEGQPDTNINILNDLPNIYFLGPKSYSSLPRYLHFFDVAILPCVLNDYTRSMFPMKFFEYLCAGKKIVTTNLDSLEEFSDCCFIAASRKDFLRGIDEALYKKLEDFSNKERIEEVLKIHTWQTRTNKMLNLINSLT